MALRTKLKKGDWIKLTSKTGSVIVGQAGHDMSTAGYAALEVIIGGDNAIIRSTETVTIKVNVNYWDVETVHHNMIGA